MKLLDLKENTEYSITITAQNDAGESDVSDPVTVRTKEIGKILILNSFG